MRLVVDSNVVFAAIVARGVTSDLLFHKDLRLLAPEFLNEEYGAYRAYLSKKAGLNVETIDAVKNRFFTRIRVFAKPDYESCRTEAERITPDPNDAPFFALALKENADIWSNDKALKRQNRVPVYSTHDLVARLFPTG